MADHCTVTGSGAAEHLAQAEANYRSDDALFHLGEGLALLEQLLGCGEPEHRMIARNLAGM